MDTHHQKADREETAPGVRFPVLLGLEKACIRFAPRWPRFGSQRTSRSRPLLSWKAAEGTRIAVEALTEFAITTANACGAADTVLTTSSAVQDAAAELRAETNKFLDTVAA